MQHQRTKIYQGQDFLPLEMLDFLLESSPWLFVVEGLKELDFELFSSFAGGVPGPEGPSGPPGPPG